MASTSSSTRQTTSTPQSLCLDAPAIGHRNGYLRLSHWNHARPGDDVVMHPLAIWSQLRCMSLTGMGLVGIVQGLAAGTTAEEVVIDFEQVPTRLDPQNDELVNRLERYEEKRVEFKLAREPERSKAPRTNYVLSARCFGSQRNSRRDGERTRDTRPGAISSRRLGRDNRLLDIAGNVVPPGGIQSPWRLSLATNCGRLRSQEAGEPVPAFELRLKAYEISYVELSSPRTSNTWRSMKFDSLPSTQRRDHAPRRCRSVVASIPF
jgi:hypothetical protein